MVDSLEAGVRELVGKAAEDLGCPVAGPVVEEQELVAEVRDVPDCPLDEEVLVPDEHHADDACHPRPVPNSSSTPG